MSHRTLSAAAVIGLAALCSAVAPAGSAPVMQDPAESSPYLTEQQQNGVAFVNAGAGKEEVAQLKQIAGQYSLQVVISGRGGEYGVADSLVVTGPNGVRVEIPDAGPWVLLKLPRGSYTLEARFQGRTERRVAAVGHGATMVNWNSPAVSG